MTATPATGSRTATFLLRQPRQVQGFREQLRSDDEVFVEGVFDQGGVFAEEQKKTALTMLWIPPGRFWIGSPPTEPDHQDNEGPQHLVQLQGFFMGQMPITQAQWRQVAAWVERPGEQWGRELKTNPAWFDGERVKIRKSSGSASDESVVLDGSANTDLHPVEQVSWHEAMEFCNRLSQRTGRHYMLPSEAQWEYACRAGTTTPFAFGATLSAELANYDATITYSNGPKGEYRKQTTPVEVFPANSWGLHDMHGNVGEWCFDHWRERHEAPATDDGPWLIKDDRELLRERVIRGGSWNSEAIHCRSASRTSAAPLLQDMKVGFRVVCLPHLPTEEATQQTGELLASEQEAEISIAELKVSLGTAAALKEAGVNTVSDLMGFSYEDLIGIPGIGSRQADAIIEALEKMGITNPQSRVEGED
jgi:formylglycine-generating enzyme required for sulfatase activity